jgi:hypothetical protein
MEFESTCRWYIGHRIEYLHNRQKVLKERLKSDSEFDYTALEEYMRNKGALRELRKLLEHLNRW